MTYIGQDHGKDDAAAIVLRQVDTTLEQLWMQDLNPRMQRLIQRANTALAREWLEGKL